MIQATTQLARREPRTPPSELARGFLALLRGAPRRHLQAWQGNQLQGLGARLLELAKAVAKSDPDERFVKIASRSWSCSVNGWSHPNWRQLSPESALALTYKGLVHLKTPFDQVLYARLLWELQPRTILELGSFQGASGLWLADQASLLCAEATEVHSFDLHPECVSPDAKHPRLHFHRVDLQDFRTFDERLLRRLPHPWLVIDDAHVDIFKVFLQLDPFLHSGDYYVFEDVFVHPNAQTIALATQIFEQEGYLVDKYYTDAFGYNVTSCPNGWLRKS